MKLSIIIPAYNEEKKIAQTLAKMDAYLRPQSYDYEIIVVNDGSKDQTARVIQDQIAQVKGLRLIDNKENHGKGWVVRQGLLAAQGDVRLFTDADNSTSIDQVEKMWPLFEKGAQVVIGSRDIEGAVMEPAQPFQRRILGEIFNLIVQFTVGLWGLWDTQCGFKAFTPQVVNEVLPLCRIDRWAFDPEILILAKKNGYEIQEVPVHWKNDLRSAVRFSGMVKMLLEVAQIRWNLITRKYK